MNIKKKGVFGIFYDRDKGTGREEKRSVHEMGFCNTDSREVLSCRKIRS